MPRSATGDWSIYMTISLSLSLSLSLSTLSIGLCQMSHALANQRGPLGIETVKASTPGAESCVMVSVVR